MCYVFIILQRGENTVLEVNSSPLDEMDTLSQMIFSDAFCERKVLYSGQYFIEVCSLESNQQ